MTHRQETYRPVAGKRWSGHVAPFEFPPLPDSELRATWAWCQCAGDFDHGMKAPAMRRVIEAVTRVRLAATRRPVTTDLKRAGANDADESTA